VGTLTGIDKRLRFMTGLIAPLKVEPGSAVSQACIAAGELIAAERQERARLRSRWPKVWKRAKAKKLRRWL